MKERCFNLYGPPVCGPSWSLACGLVWALWGCLFSPIAVAAQTAVIEQPEFSIPASISASISASTPNGSKWQTLVGSGQYDAAVRWASLRAEQGQPSSLSTLVEAADRLALHKMPMWSALLHYHSTFGGVKSQVDSPWFFQSERGKTDSRAELHATLAALFSTAAKAPLRINAYCRFVARRDWLAEQLGDTSELIPAQSCPEFDQYKQYLNAETLTLVFPTSHPNSPASAFGHTLLRVDQPGQAQDEKLLNMSINFAAEVPPGVSPLAYTFGGIGGRFPGTFRLLPYHIKLREYRQIDNRDTWEYALKLDQAQVDLVLRHTYEMLIAEFDYFFFSENCSYHLLGLLDVAFASNPMAQEFSFWTIPVDTIKVLEARDLIDSETFVPSSVRTLKQRELNLTASERQLALKTLNEGLVSISDDLDALPPERAALVLDTVGDYNRYIRLKDDNSASGLSATERALLSRRSKLGLRTDSPVVLAPDFAPQLGHDTSRVSFGTATIDGNNTRFEISYRAAYHDMRDPSTSFGTRAAIELLKVSVARDSLDGEAFLRRVTLLSIDSIEPRRGFFKPFSWRTRIGWERFTANSRHRFTVTSGGGVAYRAESINAPTYFAFLEGDLLDDPSLPNRTALQLGTRLGVHWEPRRRSRLGLEWEHRELIDTRRYDSLVSAWASLSPTRNGALILEASQRFISNQDDITTLGFEWRWYF